MNVHLDSVGCKLNQSELERLARDFQRAGHTLAASPENSDLIVINTCTVTRAAAAGSRSKVRYAHRHNPRAEIVLTGCWSSMEPNAAAALPGVTRVVPNSAKEGLVAELSGGIPLKRPGKPPTRIPLPGNRRRTRAFIKVQDGCDNHCTYCITTLARGAARSEPFETIIEEIRYAIDGGVKEVVLSGVQLSAYGKDISEDMDLRFLVERILDSTSIARLRLSSLEPWDLPQDFFSLWENPRLCRQLHLPLQTGSERILHRMGRPITPQRYADLIRRARQAIPDLAVTTDVIVGFPGEREADFMESLDFIEAMEFSGMHVFTYSPRPGTAAVRLPGHVPAQVARARAQKVKSIAAASSQAYMSKFIGEAVPVLWIRSRQTTPRRWDVCGLTDNYIRVHASSENDLWNRLTTVRLLSLAEQGGMQAERIYDPDKPA
jgi:threonylcarbamoyladenosine tRNA methylthiotransferase MtaB